MKTTDDTGDNAEMSRIHGFVRDWSKVIRDLPMGRDERCLCQGCGERYSGDLAVPDDVWERIKPEGANTGAGLLCASCIMMRIIASGIWTAARASDIDAPVSVQHMWAIKRPTEFPMAFAGTSEKAWSLAVRLTDCEYEELIEDGFKLVRVKVTEMAS